MNTAPISGTVAPSSLARTAFDFKTALAQRADRRVEARFLENEMLDPEELHLQQKRRAMSIARFAFEHTDFYRRRYTESGITAADLDDPHHFDELPVISKAELRDHQAEIIARSRGSRQRLPSSTGGSTGEPLRVFHDRRSPVAAMWWRAFRWWGIHPSDNRAIIQRERRAASTKLRELLEWWPTTVQALDATAMTDATMRAFVESWRENSPRLLSGYVGGVHEFASFVRESGIELEPPLAIGVTAAPITPSQRGFITEILRAPVFDAYRSAEVPWMAAECEAHAGLHVFSDVRVLEILDDYQRPVIPGEEGTVVVTDLCNRVFPLVRYNIGDRTSLVVGPCSCGRGLDRIRAVQGRLTDVIRLPGGRRIPGGLTGLFNERPDAVSQFQIHQHRDLAITLRCVPGAADDAREVIDHVAGTLTRLAEGTVPVRVELVQAIPHEGGKVRVVRSEAPAPGDSREVA